MKKILSLFICCMLIMSCNRKEAEKVAVAVDKMEETMVPMTRQSFNAPLPPDNKIENQVVIEKKIIRDGRIGLRVKVIEDAKTRIDSLVKYHGGYYANENFNNSDYESSYNLKIRIPASNFDRFISDIESGNGEILYKGVDARDVTDQFIDLETRLENKRSYLLRYNDLLKKANSVKEILEIEEKIRVLEEEIESTTGRLKYLNNQVDYSTLDLTLSELKDFRYNPEKRDSFFERLKQSLSKGWFGLVDLLLFIIKIWPFWIILIFIWYSWKRYRMKKRKSNRQQ